MIKAEFLKENCCIDRHAKYLTKDEYGVDAFSDEPEFDSGKWCSDEGHICRLGDVEIEEFKGKDYEDCIYKFKQSEKDWIGKLCWFWNEEDENKKLGILKSIDSGTDYPYFTMNRNVFTYCKPVKKDEIEFVEED